MPGISIDPKTTAVLIMDTTTGIVAGWAKDPSVTERAALVAGAARKAGMQVITDQKAVAAK